VFFIELHIDVVNDTNLGKQVGSQITDIIDVLYRDIVIERINERDFHIGRTKVEIEIGQ
jgi:hypothetical protein